MKNVLHQIKTSGTLLDGMCYVLQCSDGSTVVIDGGMNEDAEILLDYLKKITGESVPVIDMWFLTHAHPDHTFCCKGMGERHSREVKVKKIYYEFPSLDFKKKRDPGTVGECERFHEAVANFEGVELITSKRGDSFKFGDVLIDVLFSYSDLPSLDEDPTQGTNDTSTVLRVTCRGQTILFLGDVQVAADKVLIDLYGDKIKSDVCQVAHHGSFSSTAEFYDYVDPSILLWPVRDDRMATQLTKVRASRHLVGEMKVKDIYLAGHGTVALEMPIKAREDPFLPELPPVKNKELKARMTVKKAEDPPEKLGIDSELWNKAELLPFGNAGRIIGERPDAGFKLLWDDKGLYVMAKVNRPFYSNPDQTSSGFTDSVRVYITEKPYTDYLKFWNEVRGIPGHCDNVKFYPEEKNFPEGKRNTNLPEKCTAFSTSDENGWTACAYIKFDLPHAEGDIIGLNVEMNVVNKEGTRVAYMNMGDKRDGDCWFTLRMSDLVFVRLGK